MNKEKKSNILWISCFVPYDRVDHAGGQIENYYIKKLNENSVANIDLITLARRDELDKIDLEKYSIQYDYMVRPYRMLNRVFWGILHRINMWNVLDSYGGVTSPYERHAIKKMIKKYEKHNASPDLIIMQWTQVILLMEFVERSFPGIPVYCIEEDVLFLGFERKYKYEKNVLKRLLRYRLYCNLKRAEIEKLKRASLVINNNEKDKKLLEINGVCQNTWVWSPYYQSLLAVDYIGDKKDILFYGAMHRDENWKSAIWFLDNVFPYLEDDDVRFVIVGSRPHKRLIDRKSDRIIVTGYIDNIASLFAHSMCMVAPLLLGAGIKIKIIEAMSAGLPVLTNSIGIEGIPAVNKESYFHCESAASYIEIIKRMIEHKLDIKSVSEHEKKLVEKYFDMDKSASEFSEKVLSILEC